MGLLSETPVPFCFGFVFPKPQYSPYTIRRMSKIEPSFLPFSVLSPSPPVKCFPILHGPRVFHSGNSHDDISATFWYPDTLQYPRQHFVVPFSYLVLCTGLLDCFRTYLGPSSSHCRYGFDSGCLLVLESREVSTSKVTHKKAARGMPQLEYRSSKLSHR